MSMSGDFRSFPDLASRSLGGAVVAANDESFAERENLIRPEPATFDPSLFGHKGKVYDGWETRRRREPGADWAVVRLAAPGVVHGVVVDTAHFLGNFPPEASVEATWADGHPSTEELAVASWTTLVPRSSLSGGADNAFEVDDGRRWSHLRLTIYPDGGVARFRVHGEVVADPRLVRALGSLDLAAAEHGGRVVACSDLFYGSPSRLVAPGLARTMGEGWETARRRDEGNDWVQVRLATEGVVRVVELDTSYYVHNAPGWASLSLAAEAVRPDRPVLWRTALERVRLRPDARNRFLLPHAEAASLVRLDVYPDGGMARLRLWGAPTGDGLQRLEDRWRATGPDGR
jgi:allantoicase